MARRILVSCTMVLLRPPYGGVAKDLSHKTDGYSSEFTPLDALGAVRTIAFGINAAGTIVVGGYTDTSGAGHGFVLP